MTTTMNTTFGKCDRCGGVLPPTLGRGQTWICSCGDCRISMGPEPAQTTNPTQTRRDTIEAVLSGYSAPLGRALTQQLAQALDAALASAEHPAREAARPDPGFLLADAKARAAGVNLDGSPRREGVYTRPVPAPAADTGLVERLPEWMTQPNPKSLAEAIERQREALAAWHEDTDGPVVGAQRLASSINSLLDLAQLAARTQPPEIAEALPCDVLLPPNTRISKGCSFETLLTALRVRKGRPDGDVRFASPFVPPKRAGTKPLVVDLPPPTADQQEYLDSVRLLAASTGSRQEGDVARAQQLASGCCSSIVPCGHQQREPGTICDACKKAALRAPSPRGNESPEPWAANVRLNAEVARLKAKIERLESPRGDIEAMREACLAAVDALIAKWGSGHGYSALQEAAAAIRALPASRSGSVS